MVVGAYVVAAPATDGVAGGIETREVGKQILIARRRVRDFLFLSAPLPRVFPVLHLARSPPLSLSLISSLFRARARASTTLKRSHVSARGYRNDWRPAGVSRNVNDIVTRALTVLVRSRLN